MKSITVQWVDGGEFDVGNALRVVKSDHDRFIAGTRFDYGFMGIASNEGYKIIVIPHESTVN